MSVPPSSLQALQRIGAHSLASPNGCSVMSRMNVSIYQTERRGRRGNQTACGAPVAGKILEPSPRPAASCRQTPVRGLGFSLSKPYVNPKSPPAHQEQPRFPRPPGPGAPPSPPGEVGFGFGVQVGCFKGLGFYGSFCARVPQAFYQVFWGWGFRATGSVAIRVLEGWYKGSRKLISDASPNQKPKTAHPHPKL